MTKLERLTAVLLLLQEKQRTSEAIARHFEVSRRTVLRDIQALSEMGFPIAAREGVGGGYSLPDGLRIPPLPLTAKEAFLLLLAVGMLRGHADAPYSAERSSLEAKLRAIIPRQDLPGVERMLTAVALDVPARAQRAPLLDLVVAAAQEKRWLRITYQSAGRASIQTILPRRVSARNGLWYCAAYSRERKEERVFRVDRIRQAVQARGPFKAPPVPRAYEDPRHPEIRATFTPRGAAMAEADHDVSARITLHGDGSGVLALHCPPGELPWFARFFAGLGPEVTVEAPKELRERLAEIGRELSGKYGTAS